MIIVAVTMIGLDFPFDPAQAALTTFTVGIPAFFLTLWARPQRLPEGLLPSLTRFVVPVAIVTTLMGAGIYAIDHEAVLNSPLMHPNDLPNEVRRAYESYTGVPFGSEGYEDIVATVTAQGSLSIFVSWTAILLILFLEPPGRPRRGALRRAPDRLDNRSARVLLRHPGEALVHHRCNHGGGRGLVLFGSGHLASEPVGPLPGVEPGRMTPPCGSLGALTRAPQ